MKISNSKKQLAKIIHENGGWLYGEFAVQNGNHGRISFSENKPTRYCSTGWDACGGFAAKIECCKPLQNWHQTILSRAEYFHLYPAQDFDGWIEWHGGECPVKQGTLVDIKDADGAKWLAVKAAPQDEYSDASNVFWEWNCTERNKIVAYRLHKPEKSLEELCGEVKEENKHEHVEAKPTIEQLAADYRNAKDYAERKQEEADAAKADAEAKLAELVAAGKALKLVLSVAPVQKYTGKFYNAELVEAPAYGKDTRDAVCDGCGKRYGAHYGNHCKSGSEE